MNTQKEIQELVDKYLEENPEIKKYQEYFDLYKKYYEPYYINYLRSIQPKYVYWADSGTGREVPNLIENNSNINLSKK